MMRVFLFFCLCLFSVLEATEQEDLIIDLKNPTYKEGVLSTEEGGVISTDEFRLQAKKLVYTHKKSDDAADIHTFSAEGSVQFEWCDMILVGDHLCFDIETGQGVITNAKTAVAPWFFGAKEIIFLPDKSVAFIDGWLTTAEGGDPKWLLHMQKAKLYTNQLFSAEGIDIKLFDYKVMHFRKVKFPLDAIYNSPVRYTLRYDKEEGGRLGMRYSLFDWQGLETLLRLDWRSKRGIGGGVEFDYFAPDGSREWHAINYLAKDTTEGFINNIDNRYRFSGSYCQMVERFDMSVDLTYDKVSDKEMPTDYYDRGLLLDHTKPTSLSLRRQNRDWILNCKTRLRANSFETVKKQAPTFDLSLRPYKVGETPILGFTRIKASYLEFLYPKEIPNEQNYYSPRIFLWQKFSLPISRSGWLSTIKGGGYLIFYGNSEDSDEVFANAVIAEWNNSFDIYRNYGPLKHTVSPYCHLSYISYPSSLPIVEDHYIFDIEDGLFRLNQLKVGVEQSLVRPELAGTFMRVLHFDAYLHSLFATNSDPSSIHRIYSQCVLYPSRRARISLDSAWHLTEHMLDHINVNTGWTLSDTFALRCEYRYRGPYSWRKSDHYNYILDSFRSSEELKLSSLSDKRHTFLLHTYLRFPSQMACHVELRHGFGREIQDEKQPPYTECQVDFFVTMQSALNMRLSYRHREIDDTVTCHISVGTRPFVPENLPCRPWFVEY